MAKLGPLALLSLILGLGSLAAVAEAQTACQKGRDCFHTGCNGQLCASEEIITTCEFRCEYACYARARCRCDGGQCGFVVDRRLQQCLAGCGSATVLDDGAGEPALFTDDACRERAVLLVGGVPIELEPLEDGTYFVDGAELSAALAGGAN